MDTLHDHALNSRPFWQMAKARLSRSLATAALVLGPLALGLGMLPQPAAAQMAAPGPTLKAIRDRGIMNCGTSSVSPGFAALDSKGEYRGIDADLCRAVAAAAMGPQAKINWVPLTSQARLPALQAGQVDVLIRTVTWTQSRDASLGLNFTVIDFYDGQGFLVRKSLNITSAKQLDGATICTASGSTSELNLADWARTNGVKYTPVVFEQNDELIRAFESGRCDSISTDASQLAGIRVSLAKPDDYVVLSDRISKEPHAPVVRKGDEQWFDIVRWTMFALFIAEEKGITQANVDSFLTSKDPEVQRLLGTQGDHGPFMGVDKRWAYNAIKAVGNYGEVYERNLGMGSPLKLARGLNALWTKGGLVYAPPIR